MTKKHEYDGFDPNAVAAAGAGLFGLPFTAEQSEVIIVPVPWEATVSSGSGASGGPAAVLQASLQVDLCHHDYPGAWEHGFFLDEFPDDMLRRAARAKQSAQQVIACLESGVAISAGSDEERAREDVNRECARMNDWVYQRCSYWKQQGKTVGVLGGDHSVPLGYLRLLNDMHPGYGIVHIDAHHDLRPAYEGFTWSHASVFYNALSLLPGIGRLVQVGIRDYCSQERAFAEADERIAVFYERATRRRMFRGESWSCLCAEMIACLPDKVYISVDIDGLDPGLCPGTGTPVPGGLGFEELVFLLDSLRDSGRSIIGFDLSEVAPGNDGRDANTGARVLFHLCALAACGAAE